jgi:hypothetical protein
MTKKVITFSSHTLGEFTKCPKAFEYSQLVRIEPKGNKLAFVRGKLIGRCLEIYYKAKQRNYAKLDSLVLKLHDIILRHPGLSEGDQMKLSLRFRFYCKEYKHENWQIVAVEESFTKILYEDDEYIYLYEGTPDLVVKLASGDIAVVDHKTRSRDKDLLGLANQPLGYLWACGTEWFIYNYFGLQETGDAKLWFKRQFERFNKGLIERWASDTIETYHQARKAAEISKYSRSYNCDSKYGACQFYKVCNEVDAFGERLVINQHYKIKDDEYGVWKK